MSTNPNQNRLPVFDPHAALGLLWSKAIQTVLELADAGHRCANGERPQQAAQG